VHGLRKDWAYNLLRFPVPIDVLACSAFERCADIGASQILLGQPAGRQVNVVVLGDNRLIRVACVGLDDDFQIPVDSGRCDEDGVAFCVQQ
jgi:hypothetical protein